MVWWLVAWLHPVSWESSLMSPSLSEGRPQRQTEASLSTPSWWPTWLAGPGPWGCTVPWIVVPDLPPILPSLIISDRSFYWTTAHPNKPEIECYHLAKYTVFSVTTFGKVEDAFIAELCVFYATHRRHHLSRRGSVFFQVMLNPWFAWDFTFLHK